ncbi:MAG: putative cytochrome P450 137 [Chroococcopsis gigantea SAG 12.99]|jgi:cytochrome P450|nr:cytochrome P450 [Chlorogloea purpurea SAG 13.99]MDV2999455.1 putative cytochrome P450 137 [Chroococcopsis gigantea SAG 12.99]
MKLVPTPKTHPALQMLQWILDPLNYMEKIRKQHGEVFRAKLSSMDVVMVSDPNLVQYILTNDRGIFSAPGEANNIFLPLLGDYSVILLDGEAHRKRRQLLMPPFHGDKIKSYGDSIVSISDRTMGSIPQDKPFVARKAMQRISLAVIMETVFGIAQGEQYDILKHHICSMLDTFEVPATAAVLFFTSLQKDLGPWSPWGKFIRSRKIVDDIIYREIAARRANPDNTSTDILSLLVSATDPEGNPLTDKELRDELMTLLFAGHETTATAMSWALYWTHRYPEVKEKIRAELESSGDNPTPLEITRLPYLSAVCQETLRIHPVAMLTFPRVVMEPVNLGGYDLSPGTAVMGSIYLTHHDEKIYSQHDQFQPERFLNKQYSAYEFIPFGGGSRRCIGEALAWYELKLVLAYVVSNYELSLVHEDEEKPVRRGLTLGPSRGVKMQFHGKRVRANTISEPALISG